MPTITFIEFDGTVRVVSARIGTSFLATAKRNGVDLEGACRGSLACATCHLILTPEWYARLPPAAASEQQLLDVAFGMTTTSRLGCQLTITQDLDGCVAHIADRNRDLALSPLT
jgi:2Fe-2S ferredoxin